MVFWTDRQLCFSDGRFSCSLAPCRLEERRIQNWWVCDDPRGTLLFVGQPGGMLGGSELIYPGSEESSQSENPLAEAYWDPSQKHDGPLVFAANVTLDAATAHPALLLTEEGRRVSWQERHQNLPSSVQRFNSIPCVLGDQRFSSGRYFWKVEVGNARSWDLGVCRDNVTRTGRVTVSPQNGFWTIRFYEGEYWALTSPETHLTLREKPFIVGVFLDYEAGDISFYNMTDGSHTFTFSQNTFYGALRPLLRLWSSESGSLTICPSEGECADVIHVYPSGRNDYFDPQWKSQFSSNEIQIDIFPIPYWFILKLKLWTQTDDSISQFSCSVVSNSSRAHESQHSRPPCPSPTPGVYSISCPSIWWCHLAISSSIVPFSSCPQPLPASGSFSMSQLFAWSGQSIEVSTSAWVLPMNTQDLTPSGWTGWVSLQSKGLSRVFFNTVVQRHQFFSTQLSSQANSHIHIWPLEKP